MSAAHEQPHPVRPHLSPKEHFHRLVDDHHKVFALTPRMLRALFDEHAVIAGWLASHLLAMRDAIGSNDGYQFDRLRQKAWVGFVGEFSESEFLERMANIARKCSRYEVSPFDEKEEAYSAELMRLAARRQQLEQEDLARQEARRLKALESQSASDAELDEPSTEMPIGPARRETRAADSAAGPVPAADVPAELLPHLYLPALHPNQLQLTNVVLRCGVARIGTPNQERMNYKAEAPLRVTRISGYGFNEMTVSYTGEELRTNDLEVWAQLLKLALPVPLGERVVVRARDLLVALRRGTGGSAYAAVRKEVARLQGAVIHLRTKSQAIKREFREMFPNDPLIQLESDKTIEVSFHLLGPSTTDGNSWSIAVPREVRVAFGDGISSWYSEREYFSIESDTARRLFLFYTSHAKPWPFTVSELGAYIGSNMRRERDLQVLLHRAHDELKGARVLSNWSFGISPRRNAGEPTYMVTRAGRS